MVSMGHMEASYLRRLHSQRTEWSAPRGQGLTALHPHQVRTCLIHKRIFPGISQRVKSGVEVVEEVDNLHGPFPGGMLATECVEAHDTTEEDGHVVISFSRHRALVSQLIGHRLRKDRVQQPGQWDWKKPG